MDGIYRGVETSLLGLALLLGLVVALHAAAATGARPLAEASVTLPMIEVQADR